MGGKSFRTEVEHQKVFDTYGEVIKRYGSLSSEIRHKRYWAEIADQTNYSPESIRKIVAKFLKRHSKDYKCGCKPLKV